MFGAFYFREHRTPVERPRNVVRPYCTDACRESGFACDHYRIETTYFYCHECVDEGPRKRDNS